MTQPFPEWQQALDKDQVLSVLLDLQGQGHSIVFGRPPIVNGWTILGNRPTQWVAIRPGNNEGAWSVCVGNLGHSMGEVNSKNDLRGYLDAAMKTQGIEINDPPAQVILESSEPVSNMAKLATIIGSSTIKALWDAYLSNETLTCLANLKSLGVRIDPSVRILASNQTVASMLKQGRLTDTFFAQFKQEVAPHAEIKLCTKEHDRLILLSDGRCLSPDFSLNHVGNRGTVNTIGDSTSREQWLNTEWPNGTKWP